MTTDDDAGDTADDGAAAGARGTDAYPAGVALMYLDRPVGTLTPAQVAFLLRNDAEYIEQLMLEDEEGAAQWSKDAWDARVGAPDPDLLDAGRSGDPEGLAEACLKEAREATKDAQAKRYALDHLAAHPRGRPEYSVDAAMDLVQAAAERVCALWRECDETCGVHPAPCGSHDEAVERAKALQEIAVDAMRTAFLIAFRRESGSH